MSLHINAEKGAIAERVLLPGDPLRAKFIAETFLKDAVCYNDIRGMYGFTGTYKNVKVSVQGTGMGMPSFSIYSTELMKDYGVKTLIRVGTCGSIHSDLKLCDILLATGASTDSGMIRNRFDEVNFAPTPDFLLLNEAYSIATGMNKPAVAATVFTSDQFYDDKGAEKNRLLAMYGCSAVDMETAELYTISHKYGARALSIMSVSDHLVTGERVEPEKRRTIFTDMMEVALETIIRF